MVDPRQHETRARTANNRRYMHKISANRAKTLGPRDLTPPAPLEKHDTRRDRNVERRDLPRHGDAEDQVAVLANLLMKPLAFTAQDEHAPCGIVDLVVCLPTAFVETVDPILALL